MEAKDLEVAFSSEYFQEALIASWKKQDSNKSWQKLNELFSRVQGEDAEIIYWAIYNLQKNSLKNIAMTAYFTNDNKKELLVALNKAVNVAIECVEKPVKKPKKGRHLRLVK